MFPLGNILTIQKQSEELADQECYLSLINENFPVICGRYLTNPVARTLNEGDDMVKKKYFLSFSVIFSLHYPLSSF